MNDVRKCNRCGLPRIHANNETICIGCEYKYLKVPFERQYRKPYDHDLKVPDMWSQIINGYGKRCKRG